jgi:hypothetical protein
MSRILRSSPWVWAWIGLLGGLLVAGLWPQAPLHGVATDRIDTFAVATGPVDEDGEAIFFLDFISGDLRAAVIGRQVGKFTAFFAHNVFEDFGIDPSTKPRFLITTGVSNLTNMPRRGTGAAYMGLSKALLYVTEVTSGKVAAYALPWSPAMYSPAGSGLRPFVLLDMAKIRGGAVAMPGPVVPSSKTP